jgi:hypothetical protein
MRDVGEAQRVARHHKMTTAPPWIDWYIERAPVKQDSEPEFAPACLGSTPMAKRSFSREFKLQVVRQLVSGEKRFAQLCREHGLCQTLLRRWREQ